MRMTITDARASNGNVYLEAEEASVRPYEPSGEPFMGWTRVINMESILQAADPASALAHEICVLLTGPEED